MAKISFMSINFDAMVTKEIAIINAIINQDAANVLPNKKLRIIRITPM